MRYRSRNPLLLLVMCLAPTLYAQETLLSDAPEPSFGSAVVLPRAGQPRLAPVSGMTFSDWTLLGAAAALRYLDYQTTVKALSDPADFHEVELPQALVDNHAAFAAFEAGTLVANIWVYRLLVRHGHRRFARAGQFINLGALGGTVAFNEYNLAKYYPHTARH